MFHIANALYSSWDLKYTTTPEEDHAHLESYVKRGRIALATDLVILVTGIALTILASPSVNLFPTGFYQAAYSISTGQVALLLFGHFCCCVSKKSSTQHYYPTYIEVDDTEEGSGGDE